MSVNKVILLGRLGADPELRYTQSQTAVCNMSLATNDRRKSAEGEWTDHTEWHRIIAFGKTAENCSNYLKKGRQVFVEGKIQTRKWQDKDGKDRYTTEVIANNVTFIGSKNDDIQVQKSPQGESAGAVPPEAAASIGQAVSFDDDDIPF